MLFLSWKRLKPSVFYRTISNKCYFLFEKHYFMYGINLCIHLHMHMYYICYVINKNGLCTKGNVQCGNYSFVMVKNNSFVTVLE